MANTEMGPLPQVHGREVLCEAAVRELSSGILDLVRKYELTTAEQIGVVNAACSSWLGGLAAAAMRHERSHG